VPIRAHQDIDPVAVEGDRHADSGEDLLQQGGVAMQVFGGAKVQGDDFRRGVVDGATSA
jgi:hypothetical protein